MEQHVVRWNYSPRPQAPRPRPQPRPNRVRRGRRGPDPGLRGPRRQDLLHRLHRRRQESRARRRRHPDPRRPRARREGPLRDLRRRGLLSGVPARHARGLPKRRTELHRRRARLRPGLHPPEIHRPHRPRSQSAPPAHQRRRLGGRRRGHDHGGARPQTHPAPRRRCRCQGRQTSMRRVPQHRRHPRRLLPAHRPRQRHLRHARRPGRSLRPRHVHLLLQGRRRPRRPRQRVPLRARQLGLFAQHAAGPRADEADRCGDGEHQRLWGELSRAEPAVWGDEAIRVRQVCGRGGAAGVLHGEGGDGG
mmetsp:Transcript_22910/g.56941  ORF Transcript_22910/g.56941 Transcript_22910/m.56941 type:complete len:305 (-) Transcript_22910:337-1251(-)